ncbi:hypothetical protein HMN09_00498200 [Mycena chlorophos]|uniref:3-keto sterol reductase n=1 Tax=Mycena chlorophos TaxID=658473 RepID=A0A8H6T7T6_MYCCL|nr:hypothetical protein HMN09_00498200 [Mycena chlorophos]
MAAFPVVVVTGANAGVGFGICQRLLFQLCTSTPRDSEPEPWSTRDNDLALEPPTANGLTLILACRSVKKAEAARDDLYHLLDGHIKTLRAHAEYDGYADDFRHNLTIEVEHLDLAEISSVFDFAARVSKRHSYISHLILNAGIAPFAHIKWLVAIRQVLHNLFEAITRPAFYAQTVGELTDDGLGFTFQCNYFGHYVLFRALEPQLHNTTYAPDSRVIWSSSLGALPQHYDKADWQHVKNEYSYEAVKYQIDLAGTALDLHALRDPPVDKRVRHFVSQPGVAHTKISGNLVAVGGLLDTLKLCLFYVGRFFNTRHHSISSMNAAIATVHLSLVALSFVTFFTIPAKSKSNGGANGSANGHSQTFKPVRFGSETDRWGNAEVGLTPVCDWEENKEYAEELLVKSSDLYDSFVRARQKSA